MSAGERSREEGHEVEHGDPGDAHTESYPTMVYPPAAPTLELPAADGAGPTDLDEGDDEEWVSRTATGIRLAVPVAALIAVVLVAAGFWGGAALEKNHGSGSGAAGAFAGLASRLRDAGRSATGTTGASGATGATGASGFGGAGFAGFGGSTAAATGTLSVVDGNTLYVLTATGSLVKVTLSKTTTITRNADSTPIDLRPGDSVSVQGTTASNGDVSASSVAATAAGVSSTSGRGFGGAGAAATSTTAAG